MKLLLADSGRHTEPTGYGKNARSLIATLKLDPRFELSILQHGKRTSAPEIVELMRDVPIAAGTEGADFVLQLCPPSSCRKYDQPSGLLGYADTSEIPQSWIKALGNVDLVLAPNSSNHEIYRRHHANVALTLPGIAMRPFVPRPKYRAEGAPVFSFITVGSFSFRKGMDLLLEAFLTEFGPDEAHLHFHLQDHQIDTAINMICRLSVQYAKPPNVTVTSNKMSEEWMARFYNRADCYVTATRGEGWGLPTHEAMLCGLPVISPFSTAMRDYLNPDVAYLVDTQPVRVQDITNPFGANFKQSYGEGDIACYEPDIAQLRAQMRHVWSHRDEARLRGEAGRVHMLEHFDEAHFGRRVGDAIAAFMTARSS